MMKPDANVSLRFLRGGATLLALGIAISATGEAMIGSLSTIVGVALMVSGLHTYGRAGPEGAKETPPSAPATPPAPPS